MVKCGKFAALILGIFLMAGLAGCAGLNLGQDMYSVDTVVWIPMEPTQDEPPETETVPAAEETEPSAATERGNGASNQTDAAPTDATEPTKGKTTKKKPGKTPGTSQSSKKPTSPETAPPTETAPSVPEITETEPTEANATEMTATEPSVTEPSAAEANVTEPNVTEPSTTEPSATEANVTEPDATEPSATEANATEPSATEAMATEPTDPPQEIYDISGYTAGALEYAVLGEINARRAKEGLEALPMDARLCAIASARAWESLRVWSHTRPDGRDYGTVLADYGYGADTAAENLAHTTAPSAQDLVDKWMESQEAMGNILGEFTAIGIGIYTSDGITCIACLFVA